MERKNFQIAVEEINIKLIEMEAETENEALELVEKLYQDGEIDLSLCDFEDYKISLI
jgi:hypothetical protein